MTTSDVGVMSVACTFPRATKVVPGKNRENELWILITQEAIEDWNYWILINRVRPAGNWIVRSVVPWWGRYGWWNKNNRSPPDEDEQPANDEGNPSVTS